jgi:hypothetical protein
MQINAKTEYNFDNNYNYGFMAVAKYSEDGSVPPSIQGAAV